MIEINPFAVNEGCFRSVRHNEYIIYMECVPYLFYYLRSFFLEIVQLPFSKMITCSFFSTVSSVLKLTSLQSLADLSLHSRLNPWHSAAVCTDRENNVGCSCTNIETGDVAIFM